MIKIKESLPSPMAGITQQTGTPQSQKLAYPLKEVFL